MFRRSYLSDRLQYTNMSDSNSNDGSTSGPLMFLVYINNIIKSSRLLRFTLYADDTSVCLSGYDLNILINALSRELKLIYKLFTANKLTLNSIKSTFMIFHCWQRHFSTDINGVMINESIVKRVITMKFLGSI